MTVDSLRTFSTQPSDRSAAGSGGGTPCVAVVGYDGTAPSRAALEAAIAMVADRNGHLEVVYVAHMPWCATLTAESMMGVRQGLTNIAEDLERDAGRVLEGRHARWHFQRRDGEVSAQLVAAADELRLRHGGEASICVVVGASKHRAHRLAGAVSAALRRRAAFPVVVV